MTDLQHRIVWTAIEAFLGVLAGVPVADLIVGLDVAGTTTVLLAALGAAVAAVVTVLKEEARKRLGSTP